jgi:hypothetical protein
MRRRTASRGAVQEYLAPEWQSAAHSRNLGAARAQRLAETAWTTPMTRSADSLLSQCIYFLFAGIRFLGPKCPLSRFPRRVAIFQKKHFFFVNCFFVQLLFCPMFLLTKARSTEIHANNQYG